MVPVLFGAASAVFFGAADFIGGFAAKRIVAMMVTGCAALAGVIALGFAAPLAGGVWYAETWIGGILTGIASCLGIWLLYSAYAVGPMTTLSPVVAIVSTLVPMVAGLLTGETFSPLGWVAVTVGLIAIGLVSAAPDPRSSRARRVDVVKVAAAGAFLGVFYIYLDGGFWNVHVDEAGLTPLLANRTTCAIVAFGIVAALAIRGRGVVIGHGNPTAQAHVLPAAEAVLAGRGAAGPADQSMSGQPTDSVGTAGSRTGSVTAPRSARRLVLISAVPLALLSGTLDATANTLFSFGLEVGDLAVLSVVSGFYPAVTVGLAYFVLRERPNRLQSVGIVLSLVSLAGMSLA